LVVYWEQRGTARSFHGDIPPESMTVAQFVRDLDEVVELVRQRFGKEKVVLLGHSWGTVLGTIYAGTLSTGKLIWATLSTDEANLVDLVQFGRGNRFSLAQLERERTQIKLRDRYRSFNVPILFLLGRYDRYVPAVLAKAYFETIEAPCKRLVWFEESAHNPPFEEPEKFKEVLIKEVLPLVAERRTQTCGGSMGPTRRSSRPATPPVRPAAERSR